MSEEQPADLPIPGGKNELFDALLAVCPPEHKEALRGLLHKYATRPAGMSPLTPEELAIELPDSWEFRK